MRNQITDAAAATVSERRGAQRCRRLRDAGADATASDILSARRDA
jgi:hypothetical protein